jgi:hypothetical protein
MELNDDIFVQTNSLQTIARIKRVKCFMLHKVASVASFAPTVFAWYLRFHSLNARNSSQGDRFVSKF